MIIRSSTTIRHNTEHTINVIMFRDGSGVLLGVPGSSSVLKTAPDVRMTRVGGDPIWHDASSAISDQQRICMLCQGYMDFIIQVYAPTEVVIELESHALEKRA